MKKTTLIGLLSAFVTTVAMAQPPEEVPPPPPDGTVVEQPAVEPPAPVAEPQALPAPQTPTQVVEDTRLKGVTLAPSVTIMPLGYDDIDIGGPEGARYYFALAPEIGLSTSFKTAHDRKIDFSAGYSFRWREYYNKATTTRDIDNTFTGSLATEWTPVISTSLSGMFDYFFKSGADTNADNSIAIEVDPVMTFKVNPQLSFNVGYQMFYLALIDAKVGPDGVTSLTDPPSDAGDLGRGSFDSNASGFNNFGSVANADKTTTSMAYNRAVLGTSFSPIEGTSLGLGYKFEFYVAAVSDNDKLTGHYITPSISQQLPWKGGSVSLSNEMRFRKFKFAPADDADPASPVLQKFRNRLTLNVSQAIDQNMTFSTYYRLDLSGSNKDDYNKFAKNHQFYMGVSFGF